MCTCVFSFQFSLCDQDWPWPCLCSSSCLCFAICLVRKYFYEMQKLIFFMKCHLDFFSVVSLYGFCLITWLVDFLLLFVFLSRVESLKWCCRNAADSEIYDIASLFEQKVYTDAISKVHSSSNFSRLCLTQSSFCLCSLELHFIQRDLYWKSLMLYACGITSSFIKWN